jgi:hypothetical protein
LRTKTILDAKGRLVAPVTNYHVGTPALCNFAHFPNSNRERSKKDGRGTVRTLCIDAGDITIRIDERHVSNFAQYPRGSGLTMQRCGGAEAGLSRHEDSK